MDKAEGKKINPRILVFITPVKKEKKLQAVFAENHIPIFYQCTAHGTAPSEVLDILGIGDSTRLITIAFQPRFRVRRVFDRINNAISLHKKGGGIGFSIPLTGLQNHVLEMINKETAEKLKKVVEGDETDMKKNAAYSVIWVSVARGFSSDVVEAARTAGAPGGTILRGSRNCDESITDYLGIPLQSEQEFVMLLVEKEKKAAIMSAIAKACGLATEAHGTILSLPVDEVMGLTTASTEDEEEE